MEQAPYLLQYLHRLHLSLYHGEYDLANCNNETALQEVCEKLGLNPHFDRRPEKFTCALTICEFDTMLFICFNEIVCLVVPYARDNTIFFELDTCWVQ